jgi:RHS repeat-associated protein
MMVHLNNAEGQRVAKGYLTMFSCDMTQNGFVLTRESVLGQSGEQLAELARDESGRMAWHHTNVYAAGVLFASYDNNGLHFLLNDLLGTRRAQTDYAGVLEQTCTSLPFGNGESCSPTPTEHLFTTYQRDAESGNDYAQARYYASSQGRFLSPDPSGLSLADLTNPQSLNLYGYVMNNPLVNVDPSGLNTCTLDGFEVDCSTVQNNDGVSRCPNNDCNQTVRPNSNGPSYTLQLGQDGWHWSNNYNGSIINDKGASEVGLPDYNSVLDLSGLIFRTPRTGVPGSVGWFPDPKGPLGSGTVRPYGPNGGAVTDYDFGHNHGAGDPHAHDWNGTDRGKGRRLGPGEVIPPVPLPDAKTIQKYSAIAVLGIISIWVARAAMLAAF